MKFKKFLQEVKGSIAFFISPLGKVLYVGQNHINAIISNPDKFDLTLDEIKKIYEKYDEKLGVEGKAREEILKQIVMDGWIRIRRYPNKFWSINTYMLRKRQKNFLYKFAKMILNEGIDGIKESDKFMPVKIDVMNPPEQLEFEIVDIAEDILFESINEKDENILLEVLTFDKLKG